MQSRRRRKAKESRHRSPERVPFPTEAASSSRTEHVPNRKTHLLRTSYLKKKKSLKGDGLGREDDAASVWESFNRNKILRKLDISAMLVVGPSGEIENHDKRRGEGLSTQLLPVRHRKSAQESFADGAEAAPEVRFGQGKDWSTRWFPKNGFYLAAEETAGHDLREGLRHDAVARAAEILNRSRYDRKGPCPVRTKTVVHRYGRDLDKSLVPGWKNRIVQLR
ncbi:UNVERIFIED_CONTAM: hypothetical protein PYX00_001123 [Menopon gallinae]|uniref:Uncharacterized protein n=1 Tax=Menopon gallinae TaxID=328185 RepID=A0AAW2IBC9_9NEOP